MKILELRFKNLNSLYGEWIIDFTDPEYISNGIFALTGPTGAGKSTILDAICLALYGATPRLGKITKSSNEIMSRQTGECYAEVLFESQAGRFLCHWEQRRARKKAEGNLQDQEHQIVDAHTGKPIETKKSLVGAVIEEKTGMDFDRFTRSILLAQGGFDTFLKAEVEQKSKILEEITGTEIYSEISRRVHERQKVEGHNLELLKSEVAGIMILEPEQEKLINDDLMAKQKLETDLTDKFTKTAQAIAWLNTIESLRQEIQALAVEESSLELKINEFKPERFRLEQANKAASLDGKYASLKSIRKQQIDDQTTLQAYELALPELVASANTQSQAVQSAEQLSRAAKDELKITAPLIQKIRLLDQKISEQEKSVAEIASDCQQDLAKINTYKQALNQERQKRSDAIQQLNAVEQYLTDNTHDEWLIGGLAGVAEQLNSFQAQQNAIALIEKNLKQVNTAIADASKKLEQASGQVLLKKQELESVTNRHHQSKNILSNLLNGKLLREYRTEKDTLWREMAFVRKIEELEAQRAKLADGEACPLCGSTEHPYAHGNVPVPDAIEHKIEALTQLINKAEENESGIKKLEQIESAAHKSLNDSERLEETIINNRNIAKNTAIELSSNLGEQRVKFAELKQIITASLKPLGIIDLPVTETQELLTSLKLRLSKWQTHTQQKIAIEKQIDNINIELNRLEAVIDTWVKALDNKRDNLQNQQKILSSDLDKRKEIYGDKSPLVEEARLHKAIVDTELVEKQANNLNADLQKKLTTANTQIETLKNQIHHRFTDLEQTEQDLISSLSLIEFADENAFLAAILPAENRQALANQVKALDDAKTQLKTKQQDRKDRLTTEKAKNLTENTLDELTILSNELEGTLKELRDDIANLKSKLSTDKYAKERIKDKQSAITAQTTECHRWNNLHELIGSADGKKYRNFAQGLTFELMVSHANRQLEKMSDRYLLIRDNDRPLELNVVDNYQAGEIRSTKNLSGGESFIVSLTLALGLSKMASQKVRVDSLFLDEGFGTLDEEALDTALETLSSLQQDGKLIGIISHVFALKERISTQINIVPVSGGRSAITGPGCRNVA